MENPKSGQSEAETRPSPNALESESRPGPLKCGQETSIETKNSLDGYSTY